MTLQKAKEIIDINIKKRSPRMHPDVLEALKLGSEALKRVIEGKQRGLALYIDPLPGETEE